MVLGISNIVIICAPPPVPMGPGPPGVEAFVEKLAKNIKMRQYH